MNKVDDNSITSTQLTYLLVGSMIGIGILNLPNEVIQSAKQCGVFVVIIGGIYPIAIVAFTAYFSKIHPNKNILALSRECFGNIIGKVLNLVFAFQFIFYVTSLSSGLVNLFIISIVYFLTPIKILLIIMFCASYSSLKGLKKLSRVNGVIYFLTIILVLILACGFRGGDYKNLMPILMCDLKNIFMGAKNTMFSYAGIEILLLIYPLVKERNKIISASFKGIFTTMLIYVWVAFMTIYFTGISLTPKFLWSTTIVPKAIKIPLISNFRLVFLVLWCIILIKTISNSFFATIFIFNDCIGKDKSKLLSILFYFIFILISYYYKDEITRRMISKRIMPIVFIFNALYIIAILIITYIKERKQNES